MLNVTFLEEYDTEIETYLHVHLELQTTRILSVPSYA